MSRSIREENRLRGDADWWLGRTRVVAGRSEAIEGFTDPASVAPGGRVELRVSANPATKVVAEVFRLGWYGGAGARKVRALGPFPASPQPVPPAGPRGERECRWPASATLEVPGDWTSGVHLVRLTRADDGTQSYAIFVVRPGARAPAVIVQTSDLCWQAYNRWPDNRSSLYDTDWWLARLWPLMETADTRRRVSLDRPFGVRKWDAAPERLAAVIGSGEYLQWEYPLAYWLEQHGEDVGYVTGLDVHRDGVPGGCRLFLSVGHDEYWTGPQLRHVAAARDRGVHLGFLSGNAAFTEVALTPSAATGRPERVFRRRAMFTRREARLMGVANGYAVVGDDDWRCERPDHWLFAGTGMRRGDAIRNLVGWETHTVLNRRIRGLEVVAGGRIPFAIRSLRLGSRRWYSTVYAAPSGATVFAASTIYWPLGLARPPLPLAGHPFLSRVEPDERVAVMTRNLLRRAGVAPPG